MQNPSKPFYIFPYIVNGVKYVEAYPIHNEGNNDMPYVASIPSYRLLTLKPSRNQARKLAYKLWVHPTGRGFRKFPQSPTSTEFDMSRPWWPIVNKPWNNLSVSPLQSDALEGSAFKILKLSLPHPYPVFSLLRPLNQALHRSSNGSLYASSLYTN